MKTDTLTTIMDKLTSIIVSQKTEVVLFDVRFTTLE